MAIQLMLTETEWNERRSQNVTASSRFRNKGHLPYAFTEHGVTMLSSVLRSEKAISMGISVVRAFIAFKHYIIQQKDIPHSFVKYATDWENTMSSLVAFMMPLRIC